MNGELQLQGLAKNIVAGLPESVEPKEEEIKLRAIARQIVAGLPEREAEEIVPERPVGMRATTPEEKEFLEKEGLRYEMATTPKQKDYIISGGAWSRDPKFNYYAEKIAERAPMWLTAFAGAPVIIGIFEGLNQIRNVALTLKEKSKYDPLAFRQLSELIPEDSPNWLKVASSTGEVGADMIIAAIAARKLSPKLFKSNINRVFQKAKEAGWTEKELDKIKKLSQTLIKPGTLDEEVARAIKIKRGKIPLPRERRIDVRPEVKVRPEAPREPVVSLPGPPEAPKVAKQVVVNLMPKADGSVDVTMRPPRPEIPTEKFPGETEMVKKAKDLQYRFESGEDLTALAAELEGLDITTEIIDKHAPDVAQRADELIRAKHAKLTEEEFLRVEKEEVVEVAAEERLIKKEEAIREAKIKPIGRISTEPLSNFVRTQGGLSFTSLGELKGEAQPILESPTKKRLIRMKVGGKSLDHITEAAFEAGIIKSEDPAVFLREWSEEIAGRRPAIPSAKEAIRREAEYAEREAERYEPKVIEKPKVPPEAVEPADLWEGFLEKFEEKELTLGEYIRAEVPEAKREVAEASLRDQYADFMRAQLWSPKKIIPLLNQMKVKQPRLRNKEVYRWAQRYMLENYKPELGGPQAYLNKSLVKKFDVTGRPKEVAKLEEFEPLPEEERAREEYITAGKIGETPEEIYERKALRETVERIRSKLSPQAQKAMDGIMASRGLREDAKLMGISHDTVRSIRRDLKKKLKKNKKLASFVETIEIHEEIDRQALAIKEFETRLKVKELTEGQLSLQDIFKKVQYKKEGGETLGLFIPGGGIRGMIEEPGGETFEQWMKEVYLGITPKARKALKKLQDTIEGKVYHNPKTLKKEFDMASMYLPDEFLMRAETVYAEKAVSKITGYVKPYIEKLREKGIRESVIDRIIIEGRYPIKELVKIKREATGEISAVISKKLLDYVRKVSTAKQQTGFIKKYSTENLKKQTGKILSGFEVPQLFFRRIGLSFVYDQIRSGERKAEVLRRHANKLVKDMFKDMAKKERQEVFHFFADLQGKNEDMRMVGIEPKTFASMNPKQKRAIMKWRAFNRNYGPKVNALARKHGEEIRMVKNYFPLYSRKDIAFVQGEGIIKPIRKDPFFRSLLPRKEKVPYDVYEYDAAKGASAFSHAMSNYLEIGKVSVPIKYLIDSKEFVEIVGTENQGAIKDWFEAVVSPQRGPLFFRWFRRAGYRSFLGLNPIVTAKQGISYLDVAMIEKFAVKIPSHIKQIISRLETPSVTERFPEIAVADMTSTADRALLSWIIKADQFFAKGGLERMLSAELMAMEAEGIDLHNNKVLRQALKRVSGRLDLAMAGVTPAQRPPFYRHEFGKLALMFTSTINSRFQYYLLNVHKAAKGFKEKPNIRDANMIAKIITAFLLGGYIEKALSRMALTWDDAKSMAADVLKSTAGNVPVMAGLIYAIDAGDWSFSPVFSNFEDALEAVGKWARDEAPPEKALFEIGEVVGLPTQIQKIYYGAKIIKQGKRLTGRKTLKLDDPIEQFRALVRGQYGPLAVQKYYKIQDMRKDYRKRVAKKFIRFAKGTTLRRDILTNKPSWFKQSFWRIVRDMPLSERQDIRKMFKKIEGFGYDLSMQSILNYTKEGLK